MKLLIMQLSPATCRFIPLRPNILLSTLLSNILSLCSSFNVPYGLSFAPIQNHGQNYSVEGFSPEDNISDRFLDKFKLRTRSFRSTLSMDKII
jgi:hypothetical protein